MDEDDILSQLGLSTGHKYIDPEVDFPMRKFALDRAVNTLTRQAVAHTPQDIVAVAEIFYQFLKGETK